VTTHENAFSRLKICSSPEGAGSSPAVRTNEINLLDTNKLEEAKRAKISRQPYGNQAVEIWTAARFRFAREDDGSIAFAARAIDSLPRMVSQLAPASSRR
jgi:hypothetical protein